MHIKCIHDRSYNKTTKCRMLWYTNMLSFQEHNMPRNFKTGTCCRLHKNTSRLPKKKNMQVLLELFNCILVTETVFSPQCRHWFEWRQSTPEPMSLSRPPATQPRMGHEGQWINFIRLTHTWNKEPNHSPNRAVGFLWFSRCQSSFRSCGLLSGSTTSMQPVGRYFSTPLRSWSLTWMHTYVTYACLHIYIETVHSNIHQIKSLSTSPLSPLTTHHTWQVLLKNKWNF